MHNNFNQCIDLISHYLNLRKNGKTMFIMYLYIGWKNYKQVSSNYIQKTVYEVYIS